MSELATEDRLAVARSYVKRLEYDASGTAVEHARIRRQLDAVRAAEASAAAAAGSGTPSNPCAVNHARRIRNSTAPLGLRKRLTKPLRRVAGAPSRGPYIPIAW